MKLTEQELGEVRVMVDIIKRHEWEIGLVKQNTAFVPQGQDWVKQQEAIVNLIKNERENFIASVCRMKKIEGKIRLDLETGEIIQIKDEAGDNKTDSK